jgi:hypothetical protein
MEMARSSFGEGQGERDPCSPVSNNHKCQADLEGCINARAPDETAANPAIEPTPGARGLVGLLQQQQQSQTPNLWGSSPPNHFFEYPQLDTHDAPNNITIMSVDPFDSALYVVPPKLADCPGHTPQS